MKNSANISISHHLEGKNAPIYQLMLAVACVLGLNACAPQISAPEPDPTPTAISQPDASPVVASQAQPLPVPPTPLPQARSKFDPENPDWHLRYDELIEQFSQSFTPPAPGETINVTLLSGYDQSGILKHLTETELALEIENGVVTYTPEMLSPQSASHFFKAFHADYRARKQGSIEYRRWQQKQYAPQPTPIPDRHMTKELTTAVGGVPSDKNHKGSQDQALLIGPPKNEGPSGRVPQVEAYIRKNAALPNSLKVKAWGQVQPNKSGYKVRVQYSLEAPAGFGTSHEDMMFFMTANGRVYRKAAVK